MTGVKPPKSSPCNLTPAFVTACLIHDGLEKIREHSAHFPKEHVLAAFVAPEQDYHFYSLDQDGQWSHKPGAQKVRRVQPRSGHIDEDLRSEKYTEFLGFVKVPKQGIQYFPSMRIRQQLYAVSP